MKRLLIFSHQCWPYNKPGSTMAGQRAFHFARHLPKFGWDVTVLCGSDRSGRHVESERGRVIAIPPERARGPRAIWHRLTALRNPTAIRATARKALTATVAWTGDPSMEWTGPALDEALRLHRTERFDAVLGTHSPDGSLAAASRFASETGVPYVADFRDEPNDREHPLVGLYRARLKSWVANAARGVSTNPELVESFETRFGVPFSTIHNGFDDTEFASAPGFDWEKPTIFVSGSIYLDQQDWRDILRAVARVAGDVSVQLVYAGYAAPGFDALADDLMCRVSCYSIGMVPRSEALARLKGAAALLLAGWTSGEHAGQGITPGKLFEYIGARRPIILHPGRLNERMADIVRGGGYGWVTESPEELESAVRAAACGEVPPGWGDRDLAAWSREAGARRLSQLLDGLIGSDSGDLPPAVQTPRGGSDG